MSKYQNIVGPVIREWREKNNLTQDQLATKLNLKGWDLSRTTLSKIEAQVRCVTDLELLSLSQCIGIEPTELLRQAALYQKRKTQAKPSLGHLPSQ